jgi:TonB-linked SusC/RagA family outer membrane protein
MKKNLCVMRRCQKKAHLRKIWMTMKLMMVLFFLAITNLMASEAYSQTTKMTLQLKDATVKEVLSKIEENSEFFFLYNGKLIDVNRKVSVDVNDQKINEILSDMFRETDVYWTVVDRQIVLTNKANQNGFAQLGSQQPQKITGTVTGKDGTPIPGVNVVVTGTTQGVISDIAGKYSIEVPQGAKSLKFSFVGMEPQEITIGKLTQINVTMIESAIGLEEVVVVGYGTQKKLDITGSVSNVNSAALESKNVTTGSLALVGEMSGVSVRQLSGNPTENAAQITIRGLGTFSSAGNNPLVLVDGIESSIDNVDPNDIKGVSVLKDAASASIYGSKAANGVILVETKKGIPGAPKFSYYSYVGQQKATVYPHMVDSWDYAVAYNEALVNGGQAKLYTDEEIQKYKSGTDPAYANFDHQKYLWTSGSGLQTKQGISMSGGTPGTQYLFSAGYLDHEGIIMKNFTKRYDMRLNLNTKLMDNLNLNISVSGNTSTGKEPSSFDDKGIDAITRWSLEHKNYQPGPLGNGYYGRSDTNYSLEADLNSPSFVENKNSYLFGNAELIWNIFKDFKISGKVGYTYSDARNKWFRASYPITPTYSVTPNFLSVDWSNGSALTLQSLIEYNKSFGDHSIHILGGFSQQQNYDSYIKAYRDAFTNNEIFEIDAGTTTRGTQGGGAYESKLRSFFGRGNYSYLDKYLLEANLRYDGSSRFPKENRYGLFPSVSIGWRVSKENFFQDAFPWIDDLKIRGSWGELGNQSVGNYPYQPLISLGQNYPFGNSLAAGAAITTLPNVNIKWERTRITDEGLDLSVMDGKLALTVDHFVKTTFDILYHVSASSMLGANPSLENAGTVENRGWDFDLSHKNTLGDFSYSVSVNFSINNNEVIALANVKTDIDRGLFVGYPIGSRYGFVADGLFVDQSDIQNYATQPYPSQPGDVRYKDISGPNGVPDGIVDYTYDRTVIGKPMPTSTYGLSLTAKYKGFDLALLLQGEGGRKDMIMSWHFPGLCDWGNVQKWAFNERWTPENPDRNAGYPAMSFNYNSYETSTFWMKDATFLRLKNIQIGYNLPSKFTKKLTLDNVRIYVSGENLFTLTKFYEGWDPEMHINDWYGWYPLTRLLSAGININF